MNEEKLDDLIDFGDKKKRSRKRKIKVEQK